MRFIAIAMLPLMFGGFSTSAVAQTRVQSDRQATTGTEVKRGVEVRDTSAQETYAGYDVFQCMSAVVRKYRLLTRTVDTARYGLRAPTILPPVRQVAQQCPGAWKVDSIPPSELPTLLALYVYAADTVRENAVVTQMLALAKTPAERAKAIKDIGASNFMLLSSSVRWSGLDWALSQLKTMPGPDAARERIYLDQMVGTINNFGHFADDSTVLRYIADGLTATNALDNEDEKKDVIKRLNAARLQIALMDGDSISSNGVAMKMQPLNGTVVIGSGVYPEPGKINIVIMGRSIAYLPGAAFRRLLAKYGNAIEFVFLQSTDGNFRLKAPLTFEQEAGARKEHMINRLKLPGALLLERTEITSRPAPDYRLIRKPTPNTQYTKFGGTIIVVDGEGRMRNVYPGSMGGSVEIRLEHALDRLLGKGK